jgi:hypothetical protein
MFVPYGRDRRSFKHQETEPRPTRPPKKSQSGFEGTAKLSYRKDWLIQHSMSLLNQLLTVDFHSRA